MSESELVLRGWKVVRASELCALRRGFDITLATSEPGHIPVYSSSGVAYYHSTAMATGPAVVTGRKGLLGRVFLVNEPFWPHDTTLWATDFNGNDPAYVALVLEEFHLERLDAATSVPTLNRNNLEGHQVAIPARRSEQEAISKVASDAANAIASFERLIAKKREIKQGMMQQLLGGQTRLPGFNRPWIRTRLGDVARMGSGGTPDSKNPAFYGGGIPWVSIADMTSRGKYTKGSEKTLSQAGLDASAARLYAPGTILYAMYASIGKCSIAPGAVSSSQAILGITSEADLDTEYLYYLLTSLRPKVREMGQQGTQANLNATMVRNLALELPVPAEQRAIASVLADVDEDLDALESKLAKWVEVKQGMMQQLLTGRTRLTAGENAL